MSNIILFTIMALVEVVVVAFGLLLFYMVSKDKKISYLQQEIERVATTAAPGTTDQHNKQTEEHISTELTELQKTITEKNTELDALKVSIADNHSKLAQFNQLKITSRQTDISYENLKARVKLLEKDNASLLIKLEATSATTKESNTVDKQIESGVITNMNNELQLAQQRIDSLHQDLGEKNVVIDKLQQEVDVLQDSVTAQSNKPTTAITSNDTFSIASSLTVESEDPDTISQQIEDLLEVIVKKSEQLSALQQDENSNESRTNGLDIIQASSVDDIIPELTNTDLISADSGAEMSPNDITQSMRDLLETQEFVIDDFDIPPPILRNSRTG